MMTTSEVPVHDTIPPVEDCPDTVRVVKTCSCGTQFTLTEWKALRFVGYLDIYEDDDQRGEIRQCDECRSTCAIERTTSSWPPPPMEQ